MADAEDGEEPFGPGHFLPPADEAADELLNHVS
jgi:hypothetical protein